MLLFRQQRMVDLESSATLGEVSTNIDVPLKHAGKRATPCPSDAEDPDRVWASPTCTTCNTNPSLTIAVYTMPRCAVALNACIHPCAKDAAAAGLYDTGLEVEREA